MFSGVIFWFFFSAGEDLVLLLRNVELIQPADDLDLFPVVLVDGGDELADEGVRVQEVVGQEQLGFVADPLEQERHRLVKSVALGDEEEAVKFGVLVAGELEVDDDVLLEPGQIDEMRLLQNFRRRLAGRIAQDAQTVIEVPVQLHEADGDEAVEPRVGERLHRLLEAVAADALLQTPTLLSHRSRMLAPRDDRDLAALDDRLDLGLGQAIERRPVLHRLDEVAARLRGVALELAEVHGAT